MARYVIDCKGVVFGARFNSDFGVEHAYSENQEGVKVFVGSKYSQSKVGSSYIDVEKFLNDGRLVLFSGTPCQIYGLKEYLGNDYINLITVDFICHGVPSPKVWREYLEELSNGRSISEINFRDKTNGWLKYSLKLQYTDGKSYRKTQSEDVYMKGFLQDIYLRPSCYECRFKNVSRSSDFTLADFWGVQNQIPEMFDDKGTSIVLVHSINGKKIFDVISNKLELIVIDLEIIVKTNKNLVSSVGKPKKRDMFFELKDESIIHKINKFTYKPIHHRIIFKLKKVVKRMLNRV